MLFTSPIFLFVFLPLFIFGYFLTPKKYKNVSLLFGSLFFYVWSEWLYVFILIFSIIVDFFSAKTISNGHRKAGLFISLIFNLSILFYFKYIEFFIRNINSVLSELNVNYVADTPNILLPLGISFFTFQTMSYTIDVYRKEVIASNNILDFATYVTMFPQLIAGPIVRYKEVSVQLKSRFVNISKLHSGVQRFIIGLGKKVIIANTLAQYSDAIFILPTNEISFSTAWLGAIIYSLQIFFDFSAYSDMAIGIGKIIGFDLPENFNYPYKSKSVKEFWRRWHISLSTWFRDYFYIPIGGSKFSKIITLRNLIFVFVVTGFWHGAGWHFIAWGLFHAVLIVLEEIGLSKVLEKLPNVLRHFYLIFFIIISWVFFRSGDLSYSFGFIKAMFYNFSNDGIHSSFFFNRELTLILIVSIAMNIPILNIMKYKKSWLYDVWLIIILVVSIFYVAADTYSPFIYFRF